MKTKISQEISEASKISVVNLLGQYNTIGEYTLNDLIIGKPVIFGVSTDSTGDFGVGVKIVDGSDIGRTNYNVSGNTPFLLGRTSTYIASFSGIIVPISETVNFEIRSIFGLNTKLYVYQ